MTDGGSTCVAARRRPPQHGALFHRRACAPAVSLISPAKLELFSCGLQPRLTWIWKHSTGLAHAYRVKLSDHHRPPHIPRDPGPKTRGRHAGGVC